MLLRRFIICLLLERKNSSDIAVNGTIEGIMVWGLSGVRICVRTMVQLAIRSSRTLVACTAFPWSRGVERATLNLKQDKHKISVDARPIQKIFDAYRWRTGFGHKGLLFRRFVCAENNASYFQRTAKHVSVTFDHSRIASPFPYIVQLFKYIADRKDAFSIYIDQSLFRILPRVQTTERTVRLFRLARNTLLMLPFVTVPFADSRANERQIPEHLIELVRNWAQHPTTIMTVRRWNERHEGITKADIKRLDKAWKEQRSEAGQPLIARIHGSPLSSFLLRKKAELGGRLFESFVMDRHGLTVGLSSVTSDYLQGDEAKFQKSYGAGRNGVYFGPVERKAETGHRTQQVSLTITDPTTDEPIGAITAEFNLNIVQLY
jgi:hypothetical protein